MKLKPDLNQMMTLSAEEASVLSGIGPVYSPFL